MKLSFIGLGVQGKYLAINLVGAGHDLMVYDLRPEPLVELASLGAKVAKSCRDAGAHAEISCVCVLDDDQLRTAVAGDDGVLTGIRPGNLVVSHSTVEPRTIAEMAQAAKARDVAFVDAPVSGSELGAKNKAMAYMVGGGPVPYARCRPVRDALPSRHPRRGHNLAA